MEYPYFFAEMNSPLRKFGHSILLGIVFLLAAGSSPALLSIDNDGDDATPAVVVELNFALPCTQIVHLHKTQRATMAVAVMSQPSNHAADFTYYSQHASDEASLPLVVPLRT